MRLDTIINRDALCALRELPAESVHCCVTSPPYYALRDYGMDAQIGREDTPEQYIARLVEVFCELKRVLRPDGTFWLNIADTYCGTGSKGSYTDPKNPKGRNGQSLSLARRAAGCKQKDLIGIPWLLAFALRSDGWYLRSAIIWQKDNPMPESVRDRPSRCYENVFLLTKSKSYYYDAAPLRNPLPQQRRRDTGAGAARDTNTTARYPDRARCRASTGRGQAATTMKPSCRPRGISGTCGISTPYPTRAGISPRSRRSWRKPAFWRAVPRAALSLTRFLAAARRGLRPKALTAITSALN